MLKYDDPDIEDAKRHQYLKWFENICNPDFGLIDCLIQMFIDKVDESQMCLKILKVLRKLNEHIPELVAEQFFGNPQFPEAVVTYLETTPLENLAGDAFICFVNVFDEQTTPSLISSNFA